MKFAFLILVRHAKTVSHEDGTYELILHADFDKTFCTKEDAVWISVYCDSPDSYSYSFDGVDRKVADEEFTADEDFIIDYFLSKSNLILEEADMLEIELDEEVRYHWGLS